MTEKNYVPRNDFVLLRVVKTKPPIGELHFPDGSSESKKMIVVAVGPAVRDSVSRLEAGDEVLALGNMNVNYFEVPHARDLIVIKQEHVVLVMGEGK